jgi:hypothetical protein
MAATVRDHDVLMVSSYNPTRALGWSERREIAEPGLDRRQYNNTDAIRAEIS